MTDTGKTVEGYQIYSYEVPLNAGYDRIIFNGSENESFKQTIDLTLSESKPFFYYRYDNAGDGRNADNGKDILISTTGVKTIYFTNRFTWHQVNFYVWDKAQGTENSAFPGK